MDELNMILSLAGLGGIPFIMIILEQLKRWVTDTRWYVPMSVGIGLTLNLGLHYGYLVRTGHPLIASVIIGIIAGLSASGVYSGYSTAKEGPTADKANRPGGKV